MLLLAQLSWMPLRRGLQVIVTRWHKLVETACDPYRPERHYMRGPGPKWYAKHQTMSGETAAF
jgi:hypothetical protein